MKLFLILLTLSSFYLIQCELPTTNDEKIVNGKIILDSSGLIIAKVSGNHYERGYA